MHYSLFFDTLGLSKCQGYHKAEVPLSVEEVSHCIGFHSNFEYCAIGA